MAALAFPPSSIDTGVDFHDSDEEMPPRNALNHTPSWTGTNPHASTFHSFPPEILHLILEEYRPVYESLPLKQMKSKGISYENPPYNEYRETLHTYANLRLVSRAWYNFITPQLYASFVLSTYPPEDFERDSKAFLHRPDLIDRLVIRGSGGGGGFQCATRRLAACLKKCTNLQALDILDAHRILWHSGKKAGYYAFGSIPRTAPLKSLLLRFMHMPYQYEFAISAVFLGLGSLVRELRELWIHGPVSDQRKPTHILKLPVALPRIEKLHIRGCLGPSMQFPKLLSRIQTPTITPGSSSRRKPPSLARIINPDLQMLLGARSASSSSPTTTPLRALTLSHNGMLPNDFQSALGCHPRLAASLTSLRIRVDNFYYKGDGVLEEFPYTILRTCLNLHTFLIMNKCSTRIAEHLGRHEKLRVWGTMVVQRPVRSALNLNMMMTAIASAEDLVEIVRKVRWEGGGGGAEGKGIKKLVVEWSSDLRGKADEQEVVVEKACREAGVKFTREVDF